MNELSFRRKVWTLFNTIMQTVLSLPFVAMPDKPVEKLGDLHLHINAMFFVLT